MRLYLSSCRVGDRAGSLLALLGSGKRAAIISNGLDAVSADVRKIFREEVYNPHAELAGLGLVTEDLDLRDYFGDPAVLAERLAGIDLVWVMDGNAFVLRRAMKQSGFDDLIVEMLDRDQLVYGGSAAGAAVAAPTLQGLQLIDDPDLVPPGYEPEIVWDGLGLIDHAVIPHFRSAHPDSAAAEQAVRHLTARGLRHRALRDGEAIVWTETRARPADAVLRIA